MQRSGCTPLKPGSTSVAAGAAAAADPYPVLEAHSARACQLSARADQVLPPHSYPPSARPHRPGPGRPGAPLKRRQHFHAMACGPSGQAAFTLKATLYVRSLRGSHASPVASSQNGLAMASRSAAVAVEVSKPGVRCTVDRAKTFEHSRCHGRARQTAAEVHSAGVRFTLLLPYYYDD